MSNKDSEKTKKEEIFRTDQLLKFFFPDSTTTKITLKDMSTIFLEKLKVHLEKFKGIKDYFFENSEITTRERVHNFFKVFSALVNGERTQYLDSSAWENAPNQAHAFSFSEVL